MRTEKGIVKTILILLLCSLLVTEFQIKTHPAISEGEELHPDGNFAYEAIIESINMTRIQEDTAKLASFKSRVPGYPGSYSAIKYIKQELTKYLSSSQVHLENLTVVTPITHNASITILSPENFNVRAYPLWPNLIETCETNLTGLSGNLIYGGKGDLADLTNKSIPGNIVLMDFDSGKNWMNAVMIGAKAIIFTEPEDTTTEEAEEKKIDLPLDIPRLYVERDEAELLEELVQFNNEAKVKITSRIRFERKQTSNIIALVEGSDPELKNEIVAVCAHYDSMSIVPSLAAGAEEAVGAAALLELARILSIHQPKRSVMLVALSGHNLALAGARDFVDQHFQDIGGKIKLLLNLDLSTETDSVIALWIGQFYRFDLNPERFRWVSQRISKDYMPELSDINGKYEDKLIDALDVASWRRFIPRRFILDSEPFTMAGGLGFSYVTGYSWKRHWNTPLDTFDQLKFENLKPQLDIVFCTVYSLSGEPEIPQYNPKQFDPRGGGFLTLRGRVVEYNIEKGWYDPVPNALVLLQGKPETLIYGHEAVLMSDGDGEFLFKGALQSVVQGVMYSTRFYTANAYVDDPSPGPVDYATDLGKYTPMYTGQITTDGADNFISIGVFRCGSIAIFTCINPFTMNEIFASFQINDVRTHSPPEKWGLASDLHDAIIFVSPDLSTEIVVQKSVGGGLLGVLNNATETDPYGDGYKVTSGECLYLTGTPLRFAKQLYQLTDTYLEKGKAQGLRPISVEENNEKANEYIIQASMALSDRQYEIFYGKALQAWSLEVQAYHEIRGILGDTINTTVFFFVLLIPFAFLSERLFFEYAEGRKRLVAIAAVFGIFVSILYVVHPGFHLASNIYMTLMGFVIVVLLSPALAIVLGEAIKYLGQLRREIIGKHFTSISRLSALTNTFSIGISYMKRRKLRTALTLTGIILITFSLISFTSVLSFSIVTAKEQIGTTLYEGVLIRTGSWLPLSRDLPNYLLGEESNPSVHPRSWLYATNDPSNLRLSGINTSFTPRVILGLTINDPLSTEINASLLEGSWFSPNQSRVCLISSSAAETLHLDSDETVSWGGMNLTIAGIMNETKMRSIIDLDQESIMPLHPIQPGSGRDVHTLPQDVVIMTYSLTKSRGAQVYSVTLTVNSSNSVYDVASRLANVLTEVNVYSGLQGLVKYYEKGVGYAFQGWNLILVPLFIAAFIILNSMLSSVHERLREISVYSSIGLSPLHIAGLFLAESIVYAVVGTVFGYTLGIVGYPGLVAFGIIPSEIPLNYSSSWVMITLSVCIIVTILSTVYPMYKASRLVTPSIERSWEIPTKPEGDKWTIPLPFVTTSERELLGILAFMKEYFEAHATERGQSVFATKEISYRKEREMKSLIMEIRLAPFEMGVVQDAQVNAKLSGGKRYHFELYLHRRGGYLRVWKTSNKKFADEVRKQLLLWRGLKPEDKEDYIGRVSELRKIEEGKVGNGKA